MCVSFYNCILAIGGWKFNTEIGEGYRCIGRDTDAGGTTKSIHTLFSFTACDSIGLTLIEYLTTASRVK